LLILLKKILNPVDPEELPVNDDDYSQSHSCFWILSNIEEFEPMILDAIGQWVSFAKIHKLEDEVHQEEVEHQKIVEKGKEEPGERFPSQSLGGVKGIVLEIEIHKKRLEDSLRRLR
jgi:hypothetical protein